MFWNNHSVVKLTVNIEQGNTDTILTRLYKLGVNKTLKYKAARKKLSMNKFQFCSFSIAYLSMEDKKKHLLVTPGVLDSLLRDTMESVDSYTSVYLLVKT